MLDHLVKKGWVCLTMDYRVSPVHRWPRHVADVNAAIAWARANVDRFGGDRDFVAIAGCSAGGHLAALAARHHPHRPDGPAGPLAGGDAARLEPRHAGAGDRRGGGAAGRRVAGRVRGVGQFWESWVGLGGHNAILSQGIFQTCNFLMRKWIFQTRNLTNVGRKIYATKC